jgi:hypothetical protein
MPSRGQLKRPEARGCEVADHAAQPITTEVCIEGSREAVPTERREAPGVISPRSCASSEDPEARPIERERDGRGLAGLEGDLLEGRELAWRFAGARWISDVELHDRAAPAPSADDWSLSGLVGTGRRCRSTVACVAMCVADRPTVVGSDEAVQTPAPEHPECRGVLT